MNGELTKDEIMELLHKVEEDMPRLNAIKKQQLQLFFKLRPDRCGKIDFEKNEVEYDDEKYTEWHSNHAIEAIEDWLRIYDLVGLDYELRIAELYDPSNNFSIKYANTEADNKKYWIAWELYSLYSDCRESVWEEEQIMEALNKLYPEAYKRATAPKPVAEIKFEKIMTETGERKLCKARLDEAHLEKYRKDGVRVLKMDIDASKFENPMREELENERKIYYLEFFMDEA